MNRARRGWGVPARILHDGECWQVVIDGLAADPHPDPTIAGVDRIWTSAKRIEQHEYEYLLALKEAASLEQPDHPCLHPNKPIDPMRLRSFLPKQRTKS